MRGRRSRAATLLSAMSKLAAPSAARSCAPTGRRPPQRPKKAGSSAARPAASHCGAAPANCLRRTASPTRAGLAAPVATDEVHRSCCQGPGKRDRELRSRPTTRGAGAVYQPAPKKKRLEPRREGGCCARSSPHSPHLRAAIGGRPRSGRSKAEEPSFAERRPLSRQRSRRTTRSASGAEADEGARVRAPFASRRRRRIARADGAVERVRLHHRYDRMSADDQRDVAAGARRVHSQVVEASSAR